MKQKGFNASDFLISFSAKFDSVNPFHVFLRFIDDKNYIVVRINDESKKKVSLV